MVLGKLSSTYNIPSDESSIPLNSTCNGYKKYFDNKDQIRFDSKVCNQSELSLGYETVGHAVVELINKSKSFGIKNPKQAVVELSDKNKRLGIKNSEHAVDELSDNQKKKHFKNIICTSKKRFGE